MQLSTRITDSAAWIEAGTGPSVVFLHGMPGSRTSWGPQMEALSATHRVISWDMPGYGDTPLRPDLTTPRTMAGLLADVMRDTMMTGPAHVVGLSLGGMIAMELAIAAPDVLRSLTLLDCSPKFGLDGGSEAEDFVASVQAPLDNGVSTDDLCQEILRDLVSPDCTDETFATALSAMRRTTPEGLVQAAVLIGNHDALSRLGQICVPTMIMVGECDTATPPHYSRAIHEAIPGSRLAEVPGAGHLSNLENPYCVTAHLKTFLAGV